MGESSSSLYSAASNGNLGPVFLGVDWAIFSVSTIVVVIRLYTRIWITRNVGWDDALIALTQSMHICRIPPDQFVDTINRLGQHRSALFVENHRNFLKYSYLDMAQFFIALATCKISICLFLLRLSQFNKLRRVLWSLMGFLVISHLILFLLVVLKCDPVRKAWDLSTPGKCFSKNSVKAINIVQGGESAIYQTRKWNINLTHLSLLISDRFHCVAFPIVLLRNLNICRQSYIGLCCLKGLGIATGAIAIARTATMYQIKSPDLSWVGVLNAIARIFEVNIGNIAACIPILKPFTRYVYAKATGKGPHQILQRSARDNETDVRWYNCTWRIQWRSAYKEYASGQQATELPPNVVKMRSIGLEEASTKAETTRTGSIALPMQGARSQEVDLDSIPDVPNIRGSHYFPSGRTSQSDSGEFFGVKDMV